jgi:hypothetical protein
MNGLTAGFVSRVYKECGDPVARARRTGALTNPPAAVTPGPTPSNPGYGDQTLNTLAPSHGILGLLGTTGPVAPMILPGPDRFSINSEATSLGGAFPVTAFPDVSATYMPYGQPAQQVTTPSITDFDFGGLIQRMMYDRFVVKQVYPIVQRFYQDLYAQPTWTTTTPTQSSATAKTEEPTLADRLAKEIQPLLEQLEAKYSSHALGSQTQGFLERSPAEGTTEATSGIVPSGARAASQEPATGTGVLATAGTAIDSEQELQDPVSSENTTVHVTKDVAVLEGDLRPERDAPSDAIVERQCECMQPNAKTLQAMEAKQPNESERIGELRVSPATATPKEPVVGVLASTTESPNTPEITLKPPVLPESTSREPAEGGSVALTSQGDQGGNAQKLETVRDEVTTPKTIELHEQTSQVTASVGLDTPPMNHDVTKEDLDSEIVPVVPGQLGTSKPDDHTKVPEIYAEARAASWTRDLCPIRSTNVPSPPQDRNIVRRFLLPHKYYWVVGAGGFVLGAVVCYWLIKRRSQPPPTSVRFLPVIPPAPVNGGGVPIF